MLDDDGSETETPMKLEIALAAVPMLGHLTPLLPYAAELMARGHMVTIFHDADPKYRRTMETCGLGACRSVEYNSSDKNKDNTHNNNQNVCPMPGGMYECIKQYYEQQQRQLPAVIVHEFFAVEAADAADALGVPAVGVFINPRSINPWAKATQQQDASLWQWQLWCSVIVHGGEALLARILWCVRAYQRYQRRLPILPEQDVYPTKYMTRPTISCYAPQLELPENNSHNLPPKLFHAVGPSLPAHFDPLSPDLESWLATQQTLQRKVIYIAFGTMYQHTAQSVRQLEADLLQLGDGVAVLWSLPQKYRSLLTAHRHQTTRTSHWKIASFLPQVALLQSGAVDVFVTPPSRVSPDSGSFGTFAGTTLVRELLFMSGKGAVMTTYFLLFWQLISCELKS